MIQPYQEFVKAENHLIADNSLIIKIPAKTDEKEIYKRQEMVKSITGCLAGHEIDLDKIREERIAKRGLLE